MVEWASRFRGEHAAADYRREIPLPVADRTAARGINIAQHVGSTIDRDRRDAKSAQSATRMEPSKSRVRYIRSSSARVAESDTLSPLWG